MLGTVKRSHFHYLIKLLILINNLNNSGFADLTENYGSGGLSSARVGNVSADARVSNSGRINPSLLSAGQAPRFSYSTIVTQSAFQSSTLWLFEFTYPFQLGKLWDRRAGIGFFLSAPYGGLQSLRAYQSTDQYPLRYGNIDSQYQLNLAGSLEVIPNSLSVGAGLRFFLSGAGNGEAFISTTNPTGRLALDMGLNSAIYSGLYWRSERTSFSLVYNQEVNSEFVQKFDAKAMIGGESTFHQPITVRTSLYFEPHSLELSSQYDLGPLLMSIGISYQMWSRYRHPVLIAATEDSDGNVVVTEPPNTPIHDTWNPRLSLQVPILEDRLILGCGYRYRPSPVSDLSGIGNPIDSNTHIFGIGFTHEVPAGNFFPLFRWSLFVQKHFFEERTVTKKADLSTYSIEGSASMGGITLEVPL